MLCYKKRLKSNNDQKIIINHLTRNSKAIYNTTLYYSRKILSKNQSILNQYKTHNKDSKTTLNENFMSVFLQNTYENYKFMSNHSSQQTIKRVFKSIKSYFELKKTSNTANFPKYKDKNGRYNVFFTKNTFKKVKIGEIYFIRLTLGNYIQKIDANSIKI